MVRLRVVAAVTAAVVTTCSGCAASGTASPSSGSLTTAASAPAAATTTAPATVTTSAAAPSSPATTPAPTTTTAPAPDALAFFRAQEGPCREFARRVGNTAVEPDRFEGATVLRELANGATQIRDGRGTRLVVVPRRGIVLPASGRTDDVMPLPYEFGCSEKIFVGASHD